jgi:hypothetical protein
MAIHEFKRASRPTETDGEIVAEAVGDLTRAVYQLGTGNASTPLGAIETLALEIKAGSERIADALSDIASALRERGE